MCFIFFIFYKLPGRNQTLFSALLTLLGNYTIIPNNTKFSTQPPTNISSTANIRLIAIIGMGLGGVVEK